MIFKKSVYDYDVDMSDRQQRMLWRDWYAWYPVNLHYPEHGKIVWLDTIKIREVQTRERMIWEYRTEESLRKDGSTNDIIYKTNTNIPKIGGW